MTSRRVGKGPYEKYWRQLGFTKKNRLERHHWHDVVYELYQDRYHYSWNGYIFGLGKVRLNAPDPHHPLAGAERRMRHYIQHKGSPQFWKPSRTQMAHVAAGLRKEQAAAVAFVKTLPERDLARLDQAMHEGW